jgi:ABC-2 type transport system permease protein
MNMKELIYNIKKHIQYLLFLLNLGFQSITIYRWNYWFIVFFESLIGISMMVFIEVIYGNVELVAGWSKYEIYILYGTYNIQAQLSSAFYASGVDSFPNKVISGSLDLTIIKPMDTQYLSVFSSISLNKIFPMVFAVYMVIHGYTNLDVNLSISDVILYLLLLIIGIMMYINIVSLNMALSFWFMKISSFLSITSTVYNAAQQPKDIFGPILTKIFTFVIPVILFTNPATSVLLKNLDPRIFFYTLLMFFVTLAVSRLVWKLGLLKYQSASS